MPRDEIEVDLRSVKHMVEPMGPPGGDGLGMGITTGLDDGDAFKVRGQVGRFGPVVNDLISEEPNVVSTRPRRNRIRSEPLNGLFPS